MLKKVYLFALIVVLLVLILDFAGPVRILEYWLYDWQMLLKASVEHNRNLVAVIAVDDSTLEKFGSWPLDREVYARLLEYLKKDGAMAAGVDLLWADSFYREGDEHLRFVLTEFPGVVLARVLHLTEVRRPDKSTYHLERIEEARPFLSGGVRQGYINLFPEDDGVIRKAVLKLRIKGQEFSSLPLELYRLVGEKGLFKEKQNNGFPSGFPSRIWIDFSGLYSIPVYSLAEVLEGNYPPGAFEGRVVIIGATALSLGDYVLAPPIKDDLKPGVLVQSVILDNLLSGRFIRFYPLLNIFLLLMGAIIFSFLFFHFFPSKKWLWALFGMVITGIIGTAIFVYADLWVEWGRLIIAGLFLLIISSIVHFKREKERSGRLVQLFSRYVSGELLAEIVSGNSEELLDCRRNVTVVFIDIRGFSRFSAGRSPEEVLKMVNRYMELFVSGIFACKGLVNKFLGDGILAVFGVPLALEDHADRAFEASRMILERLEEEMLPLSAGIGLNSGEVVAGNVGNPERMEYTVIGEVVNIAARLCEYARPGEILMGEETYRSINEDNPLKAGIRPVNLTDREINQQDVIKTKVYSYRKGGRDDEGEI